MLNLSKQKTRSKGKSMAAVKKSVNILSSTMVRPSDDTPTGSLWLSRLDMMARQPYSHTRILFVYQQNKTQNNPSPLSSTPYFNTDILRKSLGKALVPFYCFAGRLQFNKSNSRYEIDCNAEGALFIEAQTTFRINDLGSEINPNTELIKQLFATVDYSKELSSIPLFMVQLTRFECGGVSLGFSTHHHAGDGSSFFGFKNSWARLAKGLNINVKPVHERFKYLAPRDPPHFEFLDSNFIEPSLPPLELYGTNARTTNRRFLLSKGLINVLKHEVMSSQELLRSIYNVTTFSVLAGHVWRSVCKARKLSHDQDVKLYMPIDGRAILKNPTLPLGYVGNTVVCATCKAKAGDIVNKPLWYAVSKVSEALTKMKDPECFRSAIDFIETRPSLEPLIRNPNNFTCPNLWINSWTKMPINEADFGWGPPNFIRHGGVQSEGHSGFLPSENEGEWLLGITLYSIHLTSFERYIYEFQADLTSQPKGETKPSVEIGGALTRCKL